MSIALIAALLLASEPATAAPPPCDPAFEVCDVVDPATGKARVWPEDVAALKDNSEACLHFAGEEGYDEERRRFLAQAIEKTCGAVKRDLPKLKKKYAADAAVLARVANIERFITEAVGPL